MYNFDAVILANGEYPTHAIPLKVLREAKYLVCCDGAANEHIARGFIPDAIIGDGDSLSEDIRRRYSHLLLRIDEQETNDLTKSIRHLLASGHRRIAIVGATGKREDHTLGNISLTVEYMRMGADVTMFTDYGYLQPCNGDTVFRCEKGQAFSIFNFTAKGLSAKGLQYPLYDFTNWWQGTLNRSTDSVVEIKASGEYIVYVKYMEE